MVVVRPTVVVSLVDDSVPPIVVVDSCMVVLTRIDGVVFVDCNVDVVLSFAGSIVVNVFFVIDSVVLELCALIMSSKKRIVL